MLQGWQRSRPRPCLSRAAHPAAKLWVRRILGAPGRSAGRVGKRKHVTIPALQHTGQTWCCRCEYQRSIGANEVWNIDERNRSRLEAMQQLAFKVGFMETSTNPGLELQASD